MVPSAYLRVFQPLDGFERSEQLHWERWLVTGRGQTGRARFADRPTGEGVGFLAPGGREAAEVRAFDGRTYLGANAGSPTFQREAPAPSSAMVPATSSPRIEGMPG